MLEGIMSHSKSFQKAFVDGLLVID